MPHSEIKVLPAEKIMSIISYFTMGIFGLILCIISRLTRRRLRYFLMYNVKQSIIIGVILFLFGISVQLIFYLISLISFLDFIVALLNLILFFKIITFSSLGMSFSFFEICVISLLLYICTGVCLSKIYNVPYLTKLTQKTMQNYSQN